jgi:hypothetical protein
MYDIQRYFCSLFSHELSAVLGLQESDCIFAAMVARNALLLSEPLEGELP